MEPPLLPLEPRSTKLHDSVVVRVTFGSDIQRQVSMNVLLDLLQAWKQNVETAHKRNKVTIARGNDENTAGC